VVFFTLTVLFWMLAARDGLGWTGTWAITTGYEGIFCGASAIYCAMAQVINENFGKVVFPLGQK
jgi:succinate-acetate transporter protein